MTARRPLLFAAVLVIGVSELALWLELRAVQNDLTALRRQKQEHRCPPAADPTLTPGRCSYHQMTDCHGATDECDEAEEEMFGG